MLKTIGGSPMVIPKPAGAITMPCRRCGQGTVTSYEMLARDEGWRCSNQACRAEYDLTPDALRRIKFPDMTPSEILRARARDTR